MRFIPFAKCQAGANDFILIEKDQVPPGFKDLSEFARRCCRRRFSLGADGLLLLEPSSVARVKMTLFNEDGSPAALSGNGVRCLARYYFSLKGEKGPLTIQTDAGLIEALDRDGEIQISIPPPKNIRMDYQLKTSLGTIRGHSIDVGVPYFGIRSEDVAREEIMPRGQVIRSHRDFPEGTNVVFFSVTGPRHVRMRCFERGVDEETLSSGTGSLAAAMISALIGGVRSPVSCENRSGETQTVSFETDKSGFRNVYLTGPASFICEGRLYLAPK